MKKNSISLVRRKKIYMPPKRNKLGTVAVGTKHYKHGISEAERIWLNKLNVPESSKVIYGYKGKILIVDGWDPKTNTAYEYLGGTFHGDHRVLKENRDKLLWIGKTANQLYMETVARFNFLYSVGIKIMFVWEYDAKKGYLGRYYRGPGDNLY